MNHLVVFSVWLVAFYGCERPIIAPVTDAQSSGGETAQKVVIEGFDEHDGSVVVGPGMVRVGWYYDFSPYDSLQINFSVKRLTSQPSADHIVVKIGPACCLQDSVSASQKEISLLVRRTDIAKYQNAALTFYLIESEASLSLSHLRVLGWTTR
jgi:hypothetical protein